MLGNVALPQRLQQGGVAAQQQKGQGASRVQNMVEYPVAAAEVGVLRRRAGTAGEARKAENGLDTSDACG